MFEEVFRASNGRATRRAGRTGHDLTMRRLLFHLSRTAPAGVLVRFVFAHAAWAMPLRIVARTRRAVVFRHPQPMCADHLLAVPRRAIRGLPAIDRDDRPWLREVLELAFAQAGTLPTPALVVINAGRWQDVPQLHAHLLAPDEVRERTHRIELGWADPVDVLEHARDVIRAEVPAGRGCALVLDPGRRRAGVVWGPRTSP